MIVVCVFVKRSGLSPSVKDECIQIPFIIFIIISIFNACHCLNAFWFDCKDESQERK